ncbi:outer membrane protein assembly factor BamB family protein [Confluentibacter sediminis]|uniref:outer membrane protein assembly factor BamB family protein n=1 Tax=Confluentibacter sediminis TaxID=2219045 RepID=UPI0013A6C9DF|nr:PQQ-binding-like beta-propeller repeat protein [Confluentibacter sediminis]
MKPIIFLFFLIAFKFLPPASSAEANFENPRIKWEFKTEGPIRGSAVIFNDKIYFGSSDGYIYSLRKEDGSLIWKFKTNGALVSAPLLSGNSLFISSRDHFVYSLNIQDGSLNWTFDMQENIPDNRPGWSYFMASPIIFENQILIGSGDSYLYALDSKDGKLNWKFKTKGRIEASGLLNNTTMYQPSNDGYVYALNVINGELLWRFETRGATYNSDDFNFDRSSIIAKPLLKNNLLIIASRDGNTYAVDLETHKEKWKFSYDTTWAMASTISENTVYIGWSTNNLFCALDLNTGEKKWQFNANSHVYTKPLVIDNDVYIGSAGGNIFKINKNTGEKLWDYNIGSEIYSSLINDVNTIYFGSDNGIFYALENAKKSHLAVFEPVKIEGMSKYIISDKKITPYLIDKGFKQLTDKEHLSTFIKNRIEDLEPSVIVFNFPIIPKNVMGSSPEKGMVRQYLESGGKIIWFGSVPNYWDVNEKDEFKRNATEGSQMLDVEFISTTDSGNYYSKTTKEGLHIGLPKWTKTTGDFINPTKKGVIPLAFDEFGRVNAWMKKFNSKPESGFISCRTWSWNVDIKETDLELIYKLAIQTYN